MTHVAFENLDNNHPKKLRVFETLWLLLLMTVRNNMATAKLFMPNVGVNICSAMGMVLDYWPTGPEMNTAGTFVLMNNNRILKVAFPPKIEPFFGGHFQVKCMLYFFISKEYRSLGLYAKLFSKVWRTLNSHDENCLLLLLLVWLTCWLGFWFPDPQSQVPLPLSIPASAASGSLSYHKSAWNLCSLTNLAPCPPSMPVEWFNN